MRGSTLHWNDVIAIRPRYQRSVHLERDFANPGALTGYVVTPLVTAIACRVAEGLVSEAGTRSWSITGPYGSGKSALALFLAKLFSVSRSRKDSGAWQLFAEGAPESAERLKGVRYFSSDGGFCPVLATGERRPLEQTLLLALERAAEAFWSGRGAKPSVLRHVARLARRASTGDAVSTRDVIALFEDVAAKVASSQTRGSGLLVILDEAGKALEYAAQAPERGDIHLLQELAEAAHRSGKQPLIFVTLLHQSFDQYAGRLNISQRREWAKVHGRFEDIAFQEDPTAVLRLIASAIEHRTDRERSPRALRDVAKTSASSVATLASSGVFRERKTLEALLGSAVPLHPVTTLVLGPLFRSDLAQNERSLFAFLSSGEPSGFQEFLKEELAAAKPTSFFSIDRLFDYVLAAYGGRLTTHQGRQIAAVEDAIRRLPEPVGTLEVRLLKAIGLLGSLGEATGLVASEEVLHAALGEAGRGSQAEIRQSLARLRAASVVVYRKYRDAYQLWEGSDLDLEDLVRKASRLIDPRTALLARFNRVMQARPIVARRHLLQSGTLRYFPVRYTDESSLDTEPIAEPNASDGADGYLWVILPSEAAMTARLSEKLANPASSFSRSKPVLVGLAADAARVRDVALDVAALEWVQAHTPELQTDRIARRELAARLAEAERRLYTEAERLFSDEAACTWYFRGQRIRVTRSRDLTRAVSEICDRVYRDAPRIRNELLNRPTLSSAAAAGRKVLLRAMVDSSGKPKLGFEGYPPEYAMYRSFLQEHGLHREEGGRWGFRTPFEMTDGSLRPAWNAIEQALSRDEGSRIKLTGLYEELRDPPYGIKDGPLPVLLIAVVMQLDAELAIYEDGTFVPVLSLAVIERLLRSPERFEVQRFWVEGDRADLLNRLAGAVLTPADSERKLLPVVRQLVRFVRQLPDFSRNTRTVSGPTQAFREALLRAKEPGPLIFRELPLALGLEPLEPRLTERSVVRLVDRLKAALRELQAAYVHLLEVVERSVGDSFGLRSSGDALRADLRTRANALMPVVVEVDLKALLIRAADEGLDREEWLASIATALAGKPPELWHDVDLERARIKLALLAQQANALESLVVAALSAPVSPGTRLLRVSVAEAGQVEHARVLAVEESRQEELQELCGRILAAAGESSNEEDVLLAMALLSQALLRRTRRPQAGPRASHT